MAIAFGTSATSAVGTTSLTCNIPASVAAGDLLYWLVGNKYPTNAPTTPAGWTLISRFSGGSGAAGADSGDVYVSVFIRIADGTEGSTATITVSSANVSIGRIIRYTKAAAKNWGTADTGGSSNTPGATWTANGAGNLGLTTSDFVLVGSIANGDIYTGVSVHLLVEIGITFGAAVERTDARNGTGDDIGIFQSEHPVTAGTATTAITYTATVAGSSGNCPAGATVILRLREVDITVSPTGIASSAAFGTPTVHHGLAATGIASSAALGTPAASHGLAATGIASGEAFGAPAVAHGLGATGIASGAVLGAPKASHGLGATGIPSGAAFGTPTVTAASLVTAVGIASGAAFGTPVVRHGLGATGIATGAILGTPAASHRVGGTAIAQALEQFGIPHAGLRVYPAAISSGASIGAPGVGLVVSPPSIPPTSAIGAGKASHTIHGVGIASGAAFGWATARQAADAIRSQIKSLLIAAGTAAGGRVFTNRAEAWASAELPAIGIYSKGEIVTIANEAPREYQREQAVTVELLLLQAVGGSSGDDELDEFEQDVWSALALNESAGDTAARSWYTGLTVTVSSSGDRRILVASIDWTYRYFTLVDETPIGAPSTVKVHGDWKLPTSTAPNDIRATDEVLTPTT